MRNVDVTKDELLYTNIRPNVVIRVDDLNPCSRLFKRPTYDSRIRTYARVIARVGGQHVVAQIRNYVLLAPFAYAARLLGFEFARAKAHLSTAYLHVRQARIGN